MSVGPEDVRKVAQLARLGLSDEEVERLTPELADILEHMEALAQVDDEPLQAEPTGRGAPLQQDERAPDALEHPPAELAPAWRDGLFLVPRRAAHDGDANGQDSSSDADLEASP